MAESPNRGRTGVFAPFEWMLAARYLRAKRQESFISVISLFSLIGIALGVATLIIVMSVMGGFRQEFLKNFLGFKGHVLVQGPLGFVRDYDAVTARLKAVPGVVRAAPILDGGVMATRNGINTGVYVRGMTRADLGGLKLVAGTLTPGSLDRFGGDDTVIVGRGLALSLHLRVGDEITLIAPKGDTTPFGTTPRIKSYRVVGTYQIGNSLYDGNYLFMPLEEAQLFFNTGQTASGIEVMLNNPDDDMAFLPALRKAAGQGYSAQPWQLSQPSLLNAVQVENDVMFLILSLIILVAALNIVSGLIMLVKDKSGDIAILRTMGATRGAVMRIFLIAGMSIGIIGTVAGLLIGVLFCLNIETIRQGLMKLTGVPLFDPAIYFLSRIPADLDPMQVTEVVAMSLALTFLATLYPSWRAARLDPVEALRYE